MGLVNISEDGSVGLFPCLTRGAEVSKGPGTVLPHYKWKGSRNTPAMEIGGHPAGLDGHQIPPHTCRDMETCSTDQLHNKHDNWED